MASASTSQPQQINVADLELSQLAEVRTQLEEELNHLTNSFTQLKQAQAKFKACIENVGEVNPNNTGKTILVPLTNSLYVPGRLSDSEHVVVDVGTGYFVKKTRPQAKKYYESKVDFIRGNLETLQETISKKQDNLNYVLNIIQAKLQAEAQSAAASKKSKS
ncbi:Prefoldin-domain-containing protein [Heliocybe sulcata]|uniref:Prefoldin-domain-containing protein n=1 Tax=Heliocybe sulcata TaxID=5364 RepID=A0A5C3N0L5_9AGAM|nr:Prefoldin-domain-containing protein [Heliocybe sulcata]